MLKRAASILVAAAGLLALPERANYPPSAERVVDRMNRAFTECESQ